MSSSSIHIHPRDSEVPGSNVSSEGTANVAAVLIGRILFSAIFILSVFGDFSQKSIAAAAQAGVPFPHILTPLAGLLALVSGLSILVGYRARLGAWGIVLFLVVVTPVMHNFWSPTDPAVVEMRQINFMKNVSMLGAALLITQFGAGPFSVDAWRRG